MSTMISSKFGLKMRQAREISKLSQEELADELNLSRVSIANYEAGKQTPSLDSAVAIALRLGFSIDELAREAEAASLENALKKVPDRQLRDVLVGALADAKKSRKE